MSILGEIGDELLKLDLCNTIISIKFIADKYESKEDLVILNC